jgi:uncharacterized protein (TIGR03437 family)
LVLSQALQARLLPREPPPSSEILLNANGANDAFTGVGQFRAALTCTGSLIDPSGLGASDAKAWLLTAGHCISLEPYGVIRNQPLTAQVQFNFFVDTPERRVTVRTRATGWSTMKGVDLALVELSATLGDLAAQGIRPLRLAPSEPQAGRAVFWTGVSGSPIPPDLQFLRLGRCTVGNRVQLIEGSWIWNNDLSNDCPDLYAGASGSPLFDAATGEVIGVIGTSTLLNFEQGPDYDCQVNRPCMIGPEGPVMERDTSYAAPVQGIPRCFDQANALDPERPGCPLDPGFQLTIQSGANEVQPVANGKPATWGAMLSGSQLYYAYKRFPAGEDNCSTFSGYSAPVLVATAPVISDPVGPENGYYFLCVIAGNTPSFDSSWQQPSYASMRFKRVDSQPPLVLVDYELETLDQAYRLTFQGGDGGTSDLGIQLEKRGPPGSTDCSDSQGYRAQISIPDTIRNSDLPTRICVKSSDKAGNFADPVVFDFGAPAMLPNAVRNAASLQRGTIAPGAAFRLDTFNLTDTTQSSAIPVATLAGVRMQVQDQTGRTFPVLLTTAGPLFLEGVMPLDLSPGPATAIVQPPQGPSLSQTVTIRRTAPGLYSGIGTGVPGGFAFDSKGNVFPLVTCSSSQGCTITPLPLSLTPGGLDFVLYGTGFRAGPDRLRIGTHTVFVRVSYHPGSAGVEQLHFHLAQDFPLRLYQAVLADTTSGDSNVFWIYLE